MSPVMVLVGPPGAGKSTVGLLLADRLEVCYRDTDADVAGVAGTSISEIFVNHGEARFRELERTAVRAALTGCEGVLALGGGAVLDPDVRAALRAEPVVFLNVGAAAAARRLGLNRDRPLLLGNVRAQWLRLMAARRSCYEEVATVTVDTDGRDPEEVAVLVLAALSSATPGPDPAGER